MSYRLSSDRMHSEGGLELQDEDGSPMCSEFRRVACPRVVVTRRSDPVPCEAPRWWRGKKTYTAVRPDGLTVTATAEAHSYDSQAHADGLALARARCIAELQAATGLIPLVAENGALLLAEDQQQLTSEPIAA